MPDLPAAEEQKMVSAVVLQLPLGGCGDSEALCLGVRVCSCLPHHSLNTIFQQFLAQKKAIYTGHLQGPSA